MCKFHSVYTTKGTCLPEARRLLWTKTKKKKPKFRGGLAAWINTERKHWRVWNQKEIITVAMRRYRRDGGENLPQVEQPQIWISLTSCQGGRSGVSEQICPSASNNNRALQPVWPLLGCSLTPAHLHTYTLWLPSSESRPRLIAQAQAYIFHESVALREKPEGLIIY